MIPVADRAMILAGGAGTRLRPLTDATPKPLLPMMGRSMLQGWLDRLADSDVDHVDILAGANPAPFIPLIAAGQRRGLHVTIRPESRPLGSAGAVLAALPHLDSTVLVINGDVATGASLDALLDHHRRHPALVTLMLGNTADVSSFGAVTTHGVRVTSFVEKPRTAPRDALFNIGVTVLNGRALEGVPMNRFISLEQEVLPGLLVQGLPINGAFTAMGWADLGTPARYVEAHRAALTGGLSWPWPLEVVMRAPNIWAHPTAAVHPRAVLRPPLLLGHDTVISAGATVGPHVVTGRSVRIRPGAVVRDAVLHDRASVGAFASLRHVIVERDAAVPPEATVSARVVAWSPGDTHERIPTQKKDSHR